MTARDTIYGQFARVAESWPERPFLWFEGDTVTYGAASRAIDRRAAFLHEEGVHAGDSVGVLSPNDPEFLYLLFATARLGATFVPFNHRQEGDVLAYLLSDADVEALVVDGSVADRYVAVRDPDEDGVHVHDGPEPGRDDGGAMRDYDDAVEAVEPADAPPAADVDPTDVAVLSYTSGTTGPPKGVQNPHLSYVDAGRRIADACGTDASDRVLIVLPLFHANPTTYGLMQMLAVGGSVAPVREFSASRFFERARASGSTFFTHVGSVLEILHRTIEDGGVDADSPLEFAIGGAAQFDRQAAFEERTGVRLVRLYGLSEVGAGMVTITPYDPDTPHGEDHQGRIDEQPFDVAILADDGTSFADEGERGEILVRPDRPGLMFRGYRGKPAAAVEAWQDLWMHTGDVGEVRDGRLHYVGREKTAIRRMGENVSPWEIEAALADWDRVAECVAVGVDDEVIGEEIGLWVVPADEDLTEAEVYDRCVETAADHLRPRYVGFLERVPRTSTHKVERASLGERSFADAWDAREHAD